MNGINPLNDFITYLKTLDLSNFEILESSDDQSMEVMSLTYISDEILGRFTILHELGTIIDIIDVDSEQQIQLLKHDNKNVKDALEKFHIFLNSCQIDYDNIFK
ncbi:hypothetical protein LVJ85_08870 [Neisseria sp. Dent CA1/247]|uniref:hypothetical protein n=1 Tax=Neisseria sp. Dent CA1/247 TaxID=2912675 RepID=UPI001FD2D815|nr:hypothetical protein [Neisseria sp. Dent CA1/247]UOO76153.1 hypothetical protein LVJ85_08870 [Neisseria sp. Dent CA1/247]